MLEWSVEALLAAPSIERVVVALPPGVVAPAGTVGVVGGVERSHSVRAALHAAGEAGQRPHHPGPGSRRRSPRQGSDPFDAVVVHDAARPLVTAELIEATLDALAVHDCDGAIAASPVTDTVKEAADGEVVRTLDRSRLWAVQTPQAFRRDALERALAQPDEVLARATDDAALVEAAGGTVRVVESPRENLKVTTWLDLRVAEALLADRNPSS
jgi:2-C-methyl-D-erythritol 4-phosphate cytidylyltransferase